MPGSVWGCGHVDCEDAKHLPVVVSQHCTPFATDGQLFWQSESAVHFATHCFGAGAAVGGTVAAGSVGCVSVAGADSSEVAQATIKRVADRTGRNKLA